MNEQLKNSVQSVRHFWAGSTKKTKRTLLLSAAVVIALAVVLAVLLNLTRYTVLYANLDLGEAQAVAAELNQQGIEFRQEGGTIYIPEDKENAVRMDLSMKGYPSSAPNYDFFTQNIDIMTTDYEKKIIEKFQMNQRLEAVIKSFEAVKSASVTINPTESSGYAWDERSTAESTASVALTFYGGKTLDAGQVDAIKRLVSTSVPNLSAENVAVIDTATSRELISSSDQAGSTAISLAEFRMTIEQEYEEEIERGIYTVLEPLFGAENVKVIAKAVMDVDKKVKEVVTYIPSQENTGVIGREETQTGSQKNGTTGGTAGEENNTETAYSGVTMDGDTLYIDDNRVYEYLVSQVMERIESDAAGVSDMTVAVVINKAGMTEEEREAVARLAAYSAAISPEKVAVHGGAFYNANQEEPVLIQMPFELEPWMWAVGIGAGGLILLLVLAVIILAVRLRRRRKREEPVQEAEEEADEFTSQLAAMRSSISEADTTEKLRLMEELHSRKQSSEEQFRKSLQDFSAQNPEIVAQIIKSWIRGEEFDE